MKNFAFPLGVKCTSEIELNECSAIVAAIGDRIISNESFNPTYPYLHIYRSFSRTGVYKSWGGIEEGMHYLDHFNIELIRDIAAACTNNTWQDDEPKKYRGDYLGITGDNSLAQTCRKPSRYYSRPTLAEICDHYGYEIKGRDIWKYAKDIEPKPQPIELTIDDIAEKYGVKPEQIKIKK